MNKDNDSSRKEILAEIDENRRVYLCEFGIVHLKWRENDLVYCPGDFLGLPFLLASLENGCRQECVQGEPCPHKGEDGLVYLPYNSVRLPFSQAECRQLHAMTLVASKRLHTLYGNGFFTAQRQKNLSPLLSPGRRRRSVLHPG